MAVNSEARARIALERRERTRRRLLDAAGELIAMRGPRAATIDEIVRHAGISRGSFYNYFRTPAEVVRELGAERAERLDREVAELLADVDDPALQLAIMGQTVLIDTMADPTGAWVNLQMDRNDQPSQPTYVRRLGEIFARGLSLDRFAPVDAAAARSLAIGAMRVAMRDMGLGLAPADHGTKVQALIMAALGVPHAEALALCEEARRRVLARRGG
jgi:AcrR family transcriptional regulator